MLNEALEYARLGWYVFPVGTDKKPYTTHGFYDASTDPGTVLAWWTRWPNAAIGIRTGAESGIVALDIDAGKGGPASLTDLIAAHGDLPDTVVSNTGGGGQHFVFKHPGERCLNSVGTLGEGVDFRGDGGYIIVAPSLHASGRRYAWAVGPFALIPAPMPEWLRLAVLHRTAPSTPTAVGGGNPLASSDAIADGSRNDQLFRMAGVLRAQGMGEEGIFSTLTAVNLSRCKPPLEDSEVASIARSVCRYDAGPPLVENWDGSGSHDLISGGEIFKPQGALLPDETDLGNARRFAERFGDTVRYVADQGSWLIWSGTHWEFDRTFQIDEMAHKVADAIQEEVRAVRDEMAALSTQLQAATQQHMEAMNDGGAVDPYALAKQRSRLAALDSQSKYLAKHAKDTKSDRSLNAMVRRAGKLPELKLSSADLNRDPFLLNVANGTLDLRTGTLRPHDRTDYVTNCLTVAYDPEATCPHWQQFLSEIMLGDADLISYLQRAVGYSLTGSVSAQVVFLLSGSGKNGKSTFVEVVQQLLGSYAGTAMPAVLSAGDRHATEVADFQGKRFMYMAEPKVRGFDTDKLKRFASSEKLKARRMREDGWEFTPTHKLWMSMNDRPEIAETNEGTWRRFQIVEFNYYVTNQNARLKEDILFPELPGILAWAVRGVLEWARIGLNAPAKVVAAGRAYREQEDIIGTWARGHLVLTVGERKPSLETYQAYKAWAEAAGCRPVRLPDFVQRLKRLGYDHREFNKGSFWMDVKLVKEGEDRPMCMVTEPSPMPNPRPGT